jgi:hypothetical protein
MIESSSFRAHRLVGLVVVSFLIPAARGNCQAPTAADSAFQRNDFAAAAAGYEKMVAADKSNGAAWFGLGVSYQSLGNVPKALDALAHARELKFRSVMTMYRMSVLLARQGQTEKALAFLDTATTQGAGAFSPQQIESESGFASLKSNPGFRKIVASVEATRYPCRSMPEAKQFDFWIGKWDVTPWTGVAAGPPGFNDVHPILEHCIVFENWRSGTGGEGKSFNFYDTNLNKWHQVWMSDSGGPLDYTGEFKDGAMRFAGWTLGPNGSRVEQKLTFTPFGKDTVRQTMEASSDGGKTWTVTFDGRYVRQKQE